MTSDWLLFNGGWQDDRWTVPLDAESGGIGFPLTYTPFQERHRAIWYYLTPKGIVLVNNPFDGLMCVDYMARYGYVNIIREVINLLRLNRGE